MWNSSVVPDRTEYMGLVLDGKSEDVALPLTLPVVLTKHLLSLHLKTYSNHCPTCSVCQGRA